jgi:hypothetical protein
VSASAGAFTGTASRPVPSGTGLDFSTANDGFEIPLSDCNAFETSAPVM